MNSSSKHSNLQRLKRPSAATRTTTLRRWRPRQCEATCVQVLCARGQQERTQVIYARAIGQQKRAQVVYVRGQQERAMVICAGTVGRQKRAQVVYVRGQQERATVIYVCARGSKRSFMSVPEGQRSVNTLSVACVSRKTAEAIAGYMQ